MIDEVRILRETFVARAEHFQTIDSTNNRAAECAARGVDSMPLLIVADEQTAGRGRGAKRWWTGPGALTFSLLLGAETVAPDRRRSPLLSLAVAAAVADAAAQLLPNHHIGLKWPNDVYCVEPMTRAFSPDCLRDASLKYGHSSFSRKLAGILIEVLANRWHVVGVGLNTNNTAADAPAELQANVCTIRDVAGQTHDQTDVLVDLLKRMEKAFAELRNSPEQVADRANELCLIRGSEVALQWHGSRATGRCRGIASDGALLLETTLGLKSFHSGTIVAIDNRATGEQAPAI